MFLNLYIHWIKLLEFAIIKIEIEINFIKEGGYHENHST
jgi:hypothetical protein